MDEELELNCQVPKSDRDALEMALQRSLPWEIETGRVTYCKSCNTLIRRQKEGEKSLYCAHCFRGIERHEFARRGALRVVGSTIGGKEARHFAKMLRQMSP